MDSEIPILVFGRVPESGLVKTRLIPLLGADGAAALYQRLLARTLATAAAAAIGPLELWCTPHCDSAFLQERARESGASLHLQVGGDLGERMLHAFEHALQRSRAALLVGTDCAILDANLLRAAAGALSGSDAAVFCPTEDGGYALIGLARCAPELFTGIHWGETSVMADTRARLRELGWGWRELAMLWDVDRPEDYQRLKAAGLL